MPLFAALFEFVMARLMLFLALMFAKKVALVVSGVAAWAAISSALYATMRSVLVPLAGALFNTSYGSIIGLAFPPIAGTVILAISSIWVACGLYAYQRRAIQMITGV